MSKIEGKEFWVEVEQGYPFGICRTMPDPHDNFKQIHVIEYSAYQKLKEKLDKAIEQRNTYIRSYNRITAETIIQELDKE